MLRPSQRFQILNSEKRRRRCLLAQNTACLAREGNVTRPYANIHAYTCHILARCVALPIPCRLPFASTCFVYPHLRLGSATVKSEQEGDTAKEAACRVLGAILALADRPWSAAGRVGLLVGGVLEALLPCLGLPKPEVIRAALEVCRTCSCAPRDWVLVGRMVRLFCTMSPVATPMKWHARKRRICGF